MEPQRDDDRHVEGGRDAPSRRPLAAALAAAALVLVGCDGEAEFELENGTDGALRVQVIELTFGRAETVAEILRPGGVVDYYEIYGIDCCISPPPPEYKIVATDQSGNVVYRHTLAFNHKERGCRIVIEADGSPSMADAGAVCEGGHSGFARHLVIENGRAGAVRVLLEGDRGELLPGASRYLNIWEGAPAAPAGRR